MSWGAVAGAAISVVGGVMGKNKADKAAKKAGRAESAAQMAAIDEEKRQFDALTKLFQPYIQGGSAAFTEMRDLIGAGTGDKANRQMRQQQAIERIQQGPEFQAQLQQGENAILQNASATGGLRGGNTQAALAQFRPRVLADVINNRFNQLGTMAQFGQASAARQAAANQQTSAMRGGYLSNIGSAQAGTALAQGQNANALYGNIAESLGTVAGKVF